jgi:hypothetical protein
MTLGTGLEEDQEDRLEAEEPEGDAAEEEAAWLGLLVDRRSLQKPLRLRKTPLHMSH